MKRTRKLLALTLAILLALLSFAIPVAAAGNAAESSFSFGEQAEHRFYQIVDKLLNMILRFLNTLIPGLNWAGKIPRLADYSTDQFYAGEQTFDTAVTAESKWSAGFAEASLLDGLDVMGGNYYLAGSMEAFNGRVPTERVDDQCVSAYALSDGVSGIVAHASVDCYGLARGDILEIRKRLSDFAAAHNIISINVSAVHQHSCIDTLGLAAPLVPAILKNPWATLLPDTDERAVAGKNPVFMENLYRTVVKTVTDAVESMTAGSLYYGAADVSELIHDKREPIVFDGNLNRLRFVPDDGARNEIWICEAGIHCVSLGAAPSELTADFPYYLKEYVKENAGADLVFVEGAELAITSDTTTLSYDDSIINGKMEALGYAMGEKLLAISDETALEPVLNVKHAEVVIPAENEILILAARENLLSSMFVRDRLGYAVVTEIGYMELGNRVGIVIAPGEIAPEMLWGGTLDASESWNNEGWAYRPLAETCGAETLLCFGITNDQIGYAVPDNECHSMLTENEELIMVSWNVASVLTKAYQALFASVK